MMTRRGYVWLALTLVVGWSGCSSMEPAAGSSTSSVPLRLQTGKVIVRHSAVIGNIPTRIHGRGFDVKTARFTAPDGNKAEEYVMLSRGWNEVGYLTRNEALQVTSAIEQMLAVKSSDSPGELYYAKYRTASGVSLGRYNPSEVPPSVRKTPCYLIFADDTHSISDDSLKLLGELLQKAVAKLEDE